MSLIERPAFYSLAPGGWRDYVTLLHPPYTAWHLSYVAIGAALAPDFRSDRLAWSLVAFFLALGIGAHALDELKGRPLRTGIPGGVLIGLAASSIAASTAIGIGAAAAWTPWLLPFVAVGGFIVVAYNLELFGGRLHTPLILALAWGGFPLLTASFASTERVRVDAVLAAVFACLATHAQQQLSTPVRKVRRRVTSLNGSLELADGASELVTPETLTAAPERALRTLSAAMVTLATALVVARVV